MAILKPSPPPLYVNGFPKAGLHLAVRMALPFYDAARPNDIWFGTNAWTVYRQNLAEAVDVLGAIQDGQYLQGHMGYLQELSQLFDGLQMLMLFVYRDLRDVVVSQTYHIMAEEDVLHHPWRDRYDGLDKEGIMIAVIQGIDDLPGIFERWETFKPWIGLPFVHAVQFEHLIKMPKRSAKRFFEFCYSAAAGKAGMDEFTIDAGLKKSLIEYTVNEMRQRHLSVTYRKGKAGQWRHEFTPRVVRAFKEADTNHELYKLGYVRKVDW